MSTYRSAFYSAPFALEPHQQPRYQINKSITADVMGKNKGAKRALTQEEIWDDSALVQSWDDAVEEYKVSYL